MAHLEDRSELTPPGFFVCACGARAPSVGSEVAPHSPEARAGSPANKKLHTDGGPIRTKRARSAVTALLSAPVTQTAFASFIGAALVEFIDVRASRAFVCAWHPGPASQAVKRQIPLAGQALEEAHQASEEPDQPRKKPAEESHNSWISRARELKTTNRKMPATQIAKKIHGEVFKRELAKSKGDLSLMEKTADTETIRRVLQERKSEWDIPQES